MREYEIYKNPAGTIEAVKKGWSWPGFFFMWIWAFVKGLYPVAIIALIVELPSTVANPFAGLFASIIVAFVIGQIGNDMRRNDLLKRGFQLMCKIEALSAEGALAQFARATSATDIVQQPQPIDVLLKLIDCPDCKKAVSRRAVACPNCGCPIVE